MFGGFPPRARATAKQSRILFLFSAHAVGRISLTSKVMNHREGERENKSRACTTYCQQKECVHNNDCSVLAVLASVDAFN